MPIVAAYTGPDYPERGAAGSFTPSRPRCGVSGTACRSQPQRNPSPIRKSTERPHPLPTPIYTC